MPAPFTVRETLIEARRLIAEKGWIQRDLESPQGFCLMGALLAASAGAPPTRTALLSARNALLRALASDSLVLWNDAPERTAADVLALLDTAIEFVGPL